MENYTIEDYYGEVATIKEDDKVKLLRSRVYNYNFNKLDGKFARYGCTVMDDPEWSSFGPEIADIEISTICHQGCEFCYKSNTPIGKNMSIDVFKKVLNKLIDKT